ncbi:DnaJ subfamily B member 13 like protein [Argiope bruennichi]|uniref:DnaJ subfamily B member 13 like protein n=1 Tax=Argiope bruennichi TaxID=94029 RepID=A0A8T0ETP9_ARGBR|nr:DnaJ subfamily B member 13 like protein [Argiope bruennichi]
MGGLIHLRFPKSKFFDQIPLKLWKLNKDPEAPERFALIGEAYDVLSTHKTRALFDQFGEEALKNGIPVPPDPTEAEGPVEVYAFHGDPMKVFKEFFGVDNPFADFYLPNLDPSYKFFEEPAKPLPGPDQTHTFPLTLEDAFYGTTKTIDLPIKVVDETETKTINIVKTFKFHVPKGTTDGHKFYFKAAGTSGPNMVPGDVTFVAELQPHHEFKLEGHNFVIKRTLYLAHALTGCTVHVTTFDNKTVHIPISEVVKPKQRIYLKGEGMPVIGFACRGDLVVEFDVSFPDSLSFAQQALIRQALLKGKSEVRKAVKLAAISGAAEIVDPEDLN